MTRRSFNTSIEGQPLQLLDEIDKCSPETEFQSLLSRDSLCNGRIDWYLRHLPQSFNPSIEGQPLQLRTIMAIKKRL